MQEIEFLGVLIELFCVSFKIVLDMCIKSNIRLKDYINNIFKTLLNIHLKSEELQTDACVSILYT